MKIAQVMLAKGFGGAERYFVDLCVALGAAGHDVLAICERRGSARARLQAKPGVRTETLFVHGWWDPLARWRLSALLQAFQPAVVQAHLARAAFLTGRARRRAQWPLLAKTHNYVDLTYYRNVDVFIPTTRDQLEFLLYCNVPHHQLEWIPNFSAVTPVVEVTVNEPAQRLLAAGRLVQKKGFAQLIEAVAELRAGGYVLQLTIAGAGPEAARLRQLVNKHGLTDSVVLSGWCDDIELLLDAADLFVLPSVDEPFGIVVLEAMARGIPVVATRTQGPVEILNDERAYLVEPGSAAALATGIAEALADAGERRQRARRALVHFKEHYATAAVVPRLLSLYQRLINQKSAPPG